MANIIDSKVENPEEVLERYIKSLDAFIRASIDNLTKIKNKHNEMSLYWKGDQYNDFTYVLENSKNDMVKELQELNKLKMALEEKLKLLKNAKSIKI